MDSNEELAAVYPCGGVFSCSGGLGAVVWESRAEQLCDIRVEFVPYTSPDRDFVVSNCVPLVVVFNPRADLIGRGSIRRGLREGVVPST